MAPDWWMQLALCYGLYKRVHHAPLWESVMDVDEDSAGRALLASDIGVGLAVLDQDGTFLFVNTVIAETAGLSAADMIGRRVTDLRSADRAAVITEVLGEVKRDGFAIRGERSVYGGRAWEAVRELLTKVVKHAHAIAVEVAIRTNGGLVLEVADNGTGRTANDDILSGDARDRNAPVRPFTHDRA
jgi:PAS domain S-box-containing protein